MAIVINGSGTVTGLAVGGLPDGIVDDGTLASNAVTEAKIASNAVVTGKLNDDAVTNAKIANDAITEHELAGGAVVTAAINDDAVTGAKVAAGAVIQVVQATGNSLTQVNTSWTDIAGASVTITPSATSSKVFITFGIGGMSNGTADNISLKMLRGSTDIRVQSRYGYDTVSGWSPAPLHMIYLDGPGSTSAVTYKMQTKTDVDNDYRLNSDQGSNGGGNGVVMTAMEIAG